MIKDYLKIRSPQELLKLAQGAYNYFCEPTHVLGGPIYVQIEPTTFCNLSCIMCSHSHHSDLRKKNLSREEFDTLFDKLYPGIKKISFVGIGEPLLNKDLSYFIEKSSKFKIHTHTTTNGLLIDENNLRALKEAGLKNLNISIDAPEKELYETIRRGGNFQRLCDNLLLLQKTNIQNRCEVVVWFVGTVENISFFPDMVGFVKKFGIKKVVMQVEQSWGQEYWKAIHAQNERSKLADFSLIHKKLEEAKERGKHCGVQVHYVNIPDKSSKRACKWPWKGFYISVDGLVTPCCIHGTDPRTLHFGNLLVEELEDILNNIKYKNFRKGLRLEVPPRFCQDCTSYYHPLQL
ncbi:MAG: radical SAM protein [Oligoflexia bacterium]|nr:radical SAM protein [Oligoflexia bacterium]